MQHLDQLATLDDSQTQSPAPMSTGASVMMMPGFATQTSRDERAMKLHTAKKFLLDFVPWPTDLFTDSQVHWLLCMRWSFVASTIKDVPILRIDADAQPTSSLERTRLLAHLIAALVSYENPIAA